MRHNIKVTNMSLMPEIASYLEKKLLKLNDFVSSEDTSVFADVELERIVTHSAGEEFRAELNIHTAHGDFRAEDTGATLLVAIDGAVGNASREMRRHKRKWIHFSRLQGLKVKNVLRGWPFRKG